MSYEECAIHDEDSTNGCRSCIRDELRASREALYAAAHDFARADRRGDGCGEAHSLEQAALALADVNWQAVALGIT